MVEALSGISTEQVRRGERILYVHPGIGSTDLLAISSHLYHLQRDMMYSFQRAGFTVEETRNDINREENVFGMQARPFRSTQERYRSIEQETGARMPQEYRTFGELQQAQLPFVLKPNGLHRGEGKILVQTETDRQHVLAVALASDGIRDAIRSSTGPHFIRKMNLSHRLEIILADAKKRIQSSDITQEMLQATLPETLIAQRFIETPGNAFTSFRVVADAEGQIAYGALLYSPKTSADKISGSKRATYARALTQIGRNDVNVYKLFTAEDSPFYIPNVHFVSNVARGGGQINLNEIPVADEDLRQLLLQHGIDPSCPKIPQRMKELARAIGKASKLDAPFVGIDFVLDGEDPDPYLLEVNMYPTIDPTDLPANDHVKTREDCYDAVLHNLFKAIDRRMAQAA